MMFSSERLPLMLKPPVVSESKPALLKLPPMTPAFSAGTPSGCGRRREELDVLRLDRLPHRDVGLQQRGLGGHPDLFGQEPVSRAKSRFKDAAASS